MKIYGLTGNSITNRACVRNCIKMALNGSFGNVGTNRSGLYRRKVKSKASLHNIRRVYKKNARQEAKINIGKEL